MPATTCAQRLARRSHAVKLVPREAFSSVCSRMDALTKVPAGNITKA